MNRSDGMISGVSLAGNISSLFSATNISTREQNGASFSEYMNGQKNSSAEVSFKTNRSNSSVKEYQKVSGSNVLKGKVKKSEETKERNVVVSNQSGKADINEKINKLTNEIKDVFQEQFEMSEEDFEKVMEVLGLTMVDVLNVNTLKEMVLYVNGEADVTDLLTNESLNASLSELLDQVSALTESAEVTAEQIADFVKTEQQDKTFEVLDESEEKKQVEESETTNEQVSEEVTETEIAFSVVREEATDAGSSKEGFNGQESSQSDMTNQFLDHVMGSMSTAQTELAEEMNAVQELKEITRQIIEEIKVVIKPETTSMELNLNPDHLGKVRLNIESQAGGLTAKFTAENEMARQAIESSIQTLRETLENQGIKVDKIEVLVSDFSFAGSNQTGEENGQGNKSKNRAFRTDEELMEHLSVDNTQSEQQVQMMNGTSIDYSA